MLIVFGTILKHIRLDYDQAQDAGCLHFAPHYHSEIGGRGALQALAASRTCVRVALVSTTGDGYEAGYMLPKLRSEGISTSAVTRSEKLSTGAHIDIYESGTLKATHIGLSAAGRVHHQQIPDETLGPGTILLLQNELPPEQNSTLLERAKQHGATTIMNLAPHAKLGPNDLYHIDYLVAAEHYAPTLSGQPIKNIIWLHDNSDASIKTAGASERIKAPALNAIDKEGCEDSFCGTFAAALHEKFSLENAVRRGCAAAALTATKRGTYSAFPYGADIEAALK
jgi:ribokinase